MMEINYIFILNPAAGKNKTALSMIPDIQKTCNKAGLRYQIHISQSGEDITNYVKMLCTDKSKKYRFYAFGGDGTLNQVINGCVGAENAEVGVFPLGTGNDFIRTTGVESKEFFDLKKQLYSPSQKIDTIKYNGKYCVNICNMGFDANTAVDMPKFKKIPVIGKSMAYNMSIAYNVCKKLGRYMEIYCDDRLLFKGDTLMCAVSNGTACGGGFKVTPRAVTNDGLIDVNVTTPPKRVKLPLFVKNFSNGTQYEDPAMEKYIHYAQCKRVTVKADKPFALVNDGEAEYLQEVTFEIMPGSINFIVPAEI